MTKSVSILIRGTVQGVGFRPWVYRLAIKLNLKGFIRNTSQGVLIEIEGLKTRVENFVQQIHSDPPVNCLISNCLLIDIPSQGFDQFQILPSQNNNDHEAFILPDIATCPECLHEIFNPTDRRYLYPFTNCTHCGPRYTIIESLPYDRPNTSMKKFTMCENCQKEYELPSNRRFHAQPNACPDCGPKISLLDDQGMPVATSQESIPAAARLVKEGAIIAVKGIGGFYLMGDALNDKAVGLLRQRKARPDKPLALMMPDLKMISRYCELSTLESQLLRSSQAPIVLLRKAHNDLKVAQNVSPHNPYLGCMLPSMPLLHILLKMLNRPLIATSGNLSEEPICIDNSEALIHLKDIADFFLVHDRPIVRHADDSVLQIICNKSSFIRRARGFAPLPIEIGMNCDRILATGAHQKNTVAIGLKTSVILSQHIGDLDTPSASLTFEKTILSLRSIYDKPITTVACDAHPQYISTRYAYGLEIDLLEIQHHHAHLASCMAENNLTKDVLGVCWDGTGLGPDGTIWGGEFLISDGLKAQRVAHLNQFTLAGGEQAIKEPRRSALGLLFELCHGNWQEYQDLPCVKSFNTQELLIIHRMIKQKINSPLTSSMGRLFDGIASLIGLCHYTSFEGQAAMALEFLISDKLKNNPYAYQFCNSSDKNEIGSIDWTDIIHGIIKDFRSGLETKTIATRFHQTLIEIIVDIARKSGLSDIALTGGCFQNRWLLENAVDRLKKEGFHPYWHSQVPSNDGGIALGQMFIAANHRNKIAAESPSAESLRYVSGNTR